MKKDINWFYFFLKLSYLSEAKPLHRESRASHSNKELNEADKFQLLPRSDLTDGNRRNNTIANEKLMIFTSAFPYKGNL